MSNSFFNFEEAPDYASQIGSTYTSLNASFDRAEALERRDEAHELAEEYKKIYLELQSKTI